MSRIWIVFRSEFLRRVKSKWFVLTTLLGPLVLIGLMVIPPIVGMMASQNNERTVAVLDRTGVLAADLTARSGDGVHFTATSDPPDSLRSAVERGRYDGYLILPEDLIDGTGHARYYSVEGSGVSLGPRLEGALNDVITRYRLAAANVSPDVREIFSARTSVQLLKLTEEGTAADRAAASSILGVMMGFVIYIAMIIYGAYVMHGVMEEKQSRVLEIIVSSVRPFELLMGKVLGIGAMGLVQMAAWACFVLGLTFSAGSIAAVFLDPSDFNLPEGAGQQELAAAANVSLPNLSPELFIWFLLFFIGGYLLYASFFAAIGSSVESQQDAQSLMFPVTILIIVPMLFISILVESPNSTLSVVLSLVPFFSPVLMVLRIAVTEVPFWQTLVSYLLLVGGFVGSIWVCGRIYRVGILMYGKKPSLRDLVRWFRYQ